MVNFYGKMKFFLQYLISPFNISIYYLHLISPNHARYYQKYDY